VFSKIHVEQGYLRHGLQLLWFLAYYCHTTGSAKGVEGGQKLNFGYIEWLAMVNCLGKATLATLVIGCTHSYSLSLPKSCI
jgi:hypothetical protein